MTGKFKVVEGGLDEHVYGIFRKILNGSAPDQEIDGLIEALSPQGELSVVGKRNPGRGEYEQLSFRFE